MVNTNRHTLMEYYRQWHMLPVDTDINPIAYIKENKILREQCFNYLLTSVDNDAPRYLYIIYLLSCYYILLIIILLLTIIIIL